jgi:hypothetical protein
MSSPLYSVTMGRGYGRMIVPVVDLAHFGNGRSLHVVRDGRPLCGVRGETRERLDACDPNAELVLRRPVCVNCRDLLGAVPRVEFVKDAR